MAQPSIVLVTRATGSGNTDPVREITTHAHPGGALSVAVFRYIGDGAAISVDSVVWKVGEVSPEPLTFVRRQDRAGRLWVDVWHRDEASAGTFTLASTLDTLDFNVGFHIPVALSLADTDPAGSIDATDSLDSTTGDPDVPITPTVTETLAALFATSWVHEVWTGAGPGQTIELNDTAGDGDHNIGITSKPLAAAGLTNLSFVHDTIDDWWVGVTVAYKGVGGGGGFQPAWARGSNVVVRAA